jgi:bifunctional non-homologous end joining protein LigD
MSRPGHGTSSALRLGQKKGQTFNYVGKVGTGFTNEVSERLRKQLAGMHILKAALTERLRKPDTKWVEPRLKAKIAFRGVTSDGKLRHPSFKALTYAAASGTAARFSRL